MKHYDMLLENKSYVTAETLKNALQGFTLKQNTLMQEMAALVEEKRLSLGIAITASTYRKYITIHKHLKGFLYHKYEVFGHPFRSGGFQLSSKRSTIT